MTAHAALAPMPLLPCPFCGGEGSHTNGQNGDGSPWYYVECLSCASMAEPDVWNARPAPAPQAEAINVTEAVAGALHDALHASVKSVDEQPDVDALDALIDAHAQNIAAGSISAAAEAREALRAALAARDAEIGDWYVFHNPDAGVEVSRNHPVDSGECTDAEHIQRIPETVATYLSEAWERAESAEAREAALLAALKPIVDDDEPTVSLHDQRKRWDENMDRARATLANLPALARGDMVLVPRVPTEKMVLAALASVVYEDGGYGCYPEKFYTAMLAAAQEKQ